MDLLEYSNQLLNHHY